MKIEDLISSTDRIFYTEEEKEQYRQQRIERQRFLMNKRRRYEQQKRIFVKAAYDCSLFSENLDTKIPVIENYQPPTNATGESKKAYIEFSKVIEQYKNDLMNNDYYNVVLKGLPGAGKTYLSLSLMLSLINENVSVLYLNMASLKSLLYDFNSRRTQNKVDRIKLIAAKVDLLIIDDLGTESNMGGYMNEAKQTVQLFLYDVMNVRQRKATLITTNHTKNDLKRTYNPKLFSRMFPKNPNHILDFDILYDLRDN